jgi:hypothetical protein
MRVSTAILPGARIGLARPAPTPPRRRRVAVAGCPGARRLHSKRLIAAAHHPPKGHLLTIEVSHDIAELRIVASKSLLILLGCMPPSRPDRDPARARLDDAGADGDRAGWRRDDRLYVSPSSLETRLMVAIAPIGMMAVIVDTFSGNPWQLKSHMYFFAALAVLPTYCDWRVLLIAAAAIALHRLVLNVLLPVAIYPAARTLAGSCCVP